MEGTVTNALSPEEKPILENIVALIQQLLTMQEAGTAQAEPEAGVMETEEDPEDETVDVAKAEGETGDSNAEERLDEQTDLTDTSLSDLGKVLSLIQARVGKSVKKAQPSRDPVLNELKALNKALTGMVQKQNNQDIFNKQILAGIGITDEVIAKNLESEPVKKDKPIQNTDTGQIVKDIMVEVFKNIPSLNQNPAYQVPFNQKRREANKNMEGILNHIHYAK